MPKTQEPWSLTSLRVKLLYIDAKVISHGHNVTFQLAEVGFAADVLMLIDQLRVPPAPA